ncbi:MAG: response regulator, partial [Myxococcota bacterium]
LSRVFRQHHLTITHRVSDAVALQEKQGWAFDVALCDIMIPPHTGLDFFEACRKAAPGLESQIIFMSGGPTNRALARRLDTLPNTLLEKPFDLVELRSIVLDLAARID